MGHCCGTPENVTTKDTPFRMGLPNDEVIRARVTVAIAGLTAGDVGWFTGADVAAFVRERVLVPVD